MPGSALSHIWLLLPRRRRRRRSRPGQHLIGRELQLGEAHRQAGIGFGTREQGVRRGNGLAQRQPEAKVGEAARIQPQNGVRDAMVTTQRPL